MPDTIFGPLVTGSDVERAALETLKAWAPTYLGWAERETGRDPGKLQRPRSYVVASDVEHWPEDQLPSVLLLSTGLADEPITDGSSTYRASFALGLAVVVSAKDQASTDALAKLYTAVLRTILLQKSSLGGFAAGVEWVDERYDPLPDPNRRRKLAAGQVVFRVDVRNVAARGGGPAAPNPTPSDPEPDPPTVREDGASVVVQPE